MTKEEIKNIVRHVFHFYESNAKNCNWTDMNEACGEILKALDQESILDEIRTEIEQRPYGIANDSVIQGMSYERAVILKIIDKYRADKESE